MNRSFSPPVSVVLRLLAAVPGGYVLTAVLVALLGGALALLGMPRSEAVSAAAMSGFLIYLLILLWAFSVQSVTKLCLGMFAGSVLAWVLLWLVQ